MGKTPILHKSQTNIHTVCAIYIYVCVCIVTIHIYNICIIHNSHYVLYIYTFLFNSFSKQSTGYYVAFFGLVCFESKQEQQLWRYRGFSILVKIRILECLTDLLELLILILISPLLCREKAIFFQYAVNNIPALCIY